MHDCEACGRSYDTTGLDGVYSVAVADDTPDPFFTTVEYRLCPSCAGDAR